jgi:hypothetical protein
MIAERLDERFERGPVRVLGGVAGSESTFDGFQVFEGAGHKSPGRS